MNRCDSYVDMGEHNKPLCKRKSLRPAKCSECPVYIRSIKEENAKLRELVRDMWQELDAATQYDAGGVRGIVSEFAESMRDLGIEV